MLQLLNAQSLLGQWGLFQATGMFLLLAPAVFCFYLVIKNRYFHPLRNFPGPFWAGVTPLYASWTLWTEEEHILFEKLHEKYGPIVRYQPDFLLFADPKMIPVIYHRHADKTEFNCVRMPGEVANVVGILDHKEHTAARKRIASPYSMTSARAMEPMIDARITEWKDVLMERFAETGAAMDFASWSQFFAYDVISEIAFGKPFGFVESGTDVYTLIKSFHTGIHIIGIIGRWDGLKKAIRHPFVVKWLMPGLDKANGMGRLVQERDNLVNERIKSSSEKPVERFDLMQHFLNAKNADGSPMSLDEVKSELLLVMFAGSDTTAASFRSLLLNVLQTPGCYDQLTAEIDAFTRSKPEFSVINYEDALSLSYFSACLKESMRFSPATPMLIPRAPPKGGLTLDDGRWIPEGMKMSAISHVTQRNKAMYGEDAGVFNPERWLKSEEQVKTMERYDLHFGSGSRTCLGKNIAFLELWKTGFEFFRTFKPTLIAPEKIKIMNIGLLVHKDIWITIEKRV